MVGRIAYCSNLKGDLRGKWRIPIRQTNQYVSTLSMLIKNGQFLLYLSLNGVRDILSICTAKGRAVLSFPVSFQGTIIKAQCMSIVSEQSSKGSSREK